MLKSRLSHVGWLAVWLVLFFGGCAEKESSVVRLPKPGADAHSGKFKTHFQDESQFIVETIAADLAEMAFYLKNKKPPERSNISVTATETNETTAGDPVYQIEIASSRERRVIKTRLEVGLPIWAPELYDGLTQAIFEGLGVAKAGDNVPPSDTSTLTALTRLTVQTIEKENLSVSDLLAGDFGNQDLHERAAVILGAFALRESSGDFFDIRSPLCRMTAHLAFVRGLKGGARYGINGRFAEAMLYTLMNNQKTALEKLSTLEPNHPELAAWVRALRTRNTHDPRVLENVKVKTLLERIELFRAVCKSVDLDIALEELSDSDRVGIADWSRVGNASSRSVGAGHLLQETSLPLELDELGKVYSLSRGSELTPDRLVEALNQLPERCFSEGSKGDDRVRVIGWGQWAMFCQRHICHALHKNFDFLQRLWGVPEAAAEFTARTETMFSGLRLYPFVRRLNCTEVASYHKAVDQAFPVIVATPHLVPGKIWQRLCSTSVAFAPFYLPNFFPGAEEWHKRVTPPGTAYHPIFEIISSSMINYSAQKIAGQNEPRDASGTLMLAQRIQANVIAKLEKLHGLAPWDTGISRNLLWRKYGNRATLGQFEDVYRPVLEYDAYSLKLLAEAAEGDPEQFERVMIKAAALNPYHYYGLGEYFFKRGQEDKGADFWEKGMQLCTDDVAAANVAGRLIKYYTRKGLTDKAHRLADAAAEVYSFEGLQAKAELLESDGNYEEALKYYRMLEERYNDSRELIHFIARFKSKTDDSRFDGELNKRLKKLFPGGLEKVDAGNIQGPPSDGVLITEDNGLLRNAGLGRGDIIVAVYGIRVHNFDQYDYVRDTRSSPEMDLVVWKGKQYLNVTASPPGHRFGANFTTWTWIHKAR